MTGRVRGALVDLMLSACPGASDVASTPTINRSTLQRHLLEEGTTYQAGLNATRQDIAIRYLTKTALEIEEIASVLANRDRNSFCAASGSGRASRLWLSGNR